eukprot:1085473-Lingulodinium_polyedra.AAC.1
MNNPDRALRVEKFCRTDGEQGCGWQSQIDRFCRGRTRVEQLPPKKLIASFEKIMKGKVQATALEK